MVAFLLYEDLGEENHLVDEGVSADWRRRLEALDLNRQSQSRTRMNFGTLDFKGKVKKEKMAKREAEFRALVVLSKINN